MALIHGLLITRWNWLKNHCNRNVSNMKRYMFFGSLKDEKEPTYKCPVCSHVGFAFEHIDGKPDVHSEVCRVCGFDGGSDSLNKDKWYQAWKECGSEVLFDKSYEERCEYMDKIQDVYLRFDFYIPTHQEIEELNINERAYEQNRFRHVIDSKRTIVVEHDGRVLRVPYETNRIININENRAYIAICERDNRRYLFLSKRFCYNKNVIRSSYFGLTPELFYISMFIENTCDVEDDMGNSYRIWVKE